MLDAYLYDGLRTPIGRHAGKLAPVRPDDLAAEVLKEVVTRNQRQPGRDQRRGDGLRDQAGEDSRNVARFAALLAGLPPTTPGVTVNRLCASGLQAVVDAARAVTCGEGDLYVAGGVESMSRAPTMGKSDSPYSRDVKMFDTTIGARFPNPKVVKQYGNHRCRKPATTSPRTSASRASRPTSSRSPRQQHGGGRGLLQRRDPRRDDSLEEGTARR